MYKLSYAFKFQPEEHDPDQLGFWFATEKLYSECKKILNSDVSVWQT